VDIVFDYGVPTNECQPQVVAYGVKVDGSLLTIEQLFNPQIKLKVNQTVEVWTTANVK
jgi:hypothetical protein